MIVGAEHRVIKISPFDKNDLSMLFFVTGLYLEHNSHSVVREAYVLQLTSETVGLQEFLPSTTDISVPKKEMEFWRSALPAMTERCRNWKHLPSCEYLENIPVSLEPATRSICSCGMGKVGDGFKGFEKWEEFAPFVTRVAISSLFAAAYVEPTRGVVRRGGQEGTRSFAGGQFTLPPMPVRSRQG
jgi:hypothetical protein